MDRYAEARFGVSFTELTAEQQDAILTNMEANTAPGFTPNSRTFFTLIRTHAIQGMFRRPLLRWQYEHGRLEADRLPGDRAGCTGGRAACRRHAAGGEESAYDYELFKGRETGAKRGHN